jgi:tetratricopeptide (TPR) repeat protein/nucleoside-triphosphatase THEP1
MVGRTAELALLKQAWTAVGQGQRRLALVSGETGIGKSTLVAQFSRDTGMAKAAVFSVSCNSYTRAAPLWAVGRLLQQAAGLAGSPSADHEAVLNWLTRLGLPAAEIRPYLAAILGQPNPESGLSAELSRQDADMLHRQIHAMLRRVWLAVARLAPTVFIVEDVQWLDLASGEFLCYLIKTTMDEPFLLIATTRRTDDSPVVGQLLAANNAGAEAWLQVVLEPLPTPPNHQLIDQFIAQSSPDFHPLKQKIAERSHGNPLFIKEITHMLIDQGGLTRTAPGQPWQVSPQANELLQTVPASIKGLILARFDRLPAEVRRTLQTAAVAGHAFPHGLIYGSTGSRAETLVTQLQILERRGFLHTQPFYGQAGYAFQHALLHDAIYSTLLKRDRQELHGRLAQTIDQSYDWPPEEKIAVLAHHYAESSQPAQAIPYLTTAANMAAQQCAHHTAIEQYRRAINLAPPQEKPATPAFFEIRVGLGRSLKFVGDLAPAGELLTQTWQQFPPVEPPAEADPLWQMRVETLRQLADVRQREGLYDQALQYLEIGLDLLGPAGPTKNPQVWRLLVERQAWINFRQGHLSQAFNLAKSAVHGLDPQQLDNAAALARLYNTMGGIVWQQGHPDQAIDYVERSLGLYKKLAYDWGIANAYSNLGILHDVTGLWAKAAEYHQQTLNLRLQMGDVQHQATTLDNLGVLHMSMGQFEATLLLANSALAQAKAAGLAFEEIDCMRTAGMVQHRAGQSETACQLLEESAALAQEQGDPYRRGLALLEIGRICEPKALTLAIEIFQMLGAAHDLQQAQTWLEATRE